MSNVSISEVSRNLADFINRVAYRGESFVLYRGKKAVAELRPVPAVKKLGELKSILNALPKLSEKESESFLKDLTDIRAEGNKEILGDPWES